MFFPLSVQDVVRDPFDPAGRIDREISDRSRRLAVGTTISDDLHSVVSALVVTTGKGKYLRILSATTSKHNLPEFTSELLIQVASGELQPDIVELQNLQTDITMVQAAAIEELKASAGKYVDRLLAASVTQPDLFPGQRPRTALAAFDLSHAQLLAEQTGLSIVSSFAQRDILAGGNGLNLDALPAWILFSDRSHRVASTNRVLFDIGRQARAFFLPASDGIDSDLPDVRFAATVGLERFTDFLRQHDLSLDDLHRLNLNSTPGSGIDHDSLNRPQQSPAITRADHVRSRVVSLVKEISQQISEEVPASTPIDEIVIATDPRIMGTFANQFRRNWPKTNVFDGFGWDGCSNHLQPILAATLGVLSLDQLPANIPWITGAHSQKVLGTLTPGSPSNWRQLLRDMADFQPPVMRLRDAV